VLANARSFPLRVRTDENPPLAKFAADFGILERVLPGNEKALLPVTVRNVEPVLPGQVSVVRAATVAKETPIPGQVAQVKRGDDMQIIAWFRRLARANKIEREYNDKTEQWTVKRNGYAQSIFTGADVKTKIAVPKPLGAKAFRGRRHSVAEPGLLRRRAREPEARRRAAGRAQAVLRSRGHTRHEPERSLQARTRIVAGLGDPVERCRAGGHAAVAVRDCSGHTYWEGRADASGIARVNVQLPERDGLPSCGTEDSLREFFVTAHSGDDMAFAFSSWGEGIARGGSMCRPRATTVPISPTRCLDRSLVRSARRVDESIRAAADGRRFCAAVAQGARGHADDSAPGLGKGIHGAGPVDGQRHAASGERASKCRRTPMRAPTRSWSAIRCLPARGTKASGPPGPFGSKRFGCRSCARVCSRSACRSSIPPTSASICR
jgi:hypothetical protein